MLNTNAQCYQSISQVLLTSALIAYMYARFRYSEKNPMRLAVFGPPLRPPRKLTVTTLEKGSGALFNPRGILLHLQRPNGVMNAVSCLFACPYPPD